MFFGGQVIRVGGASLHLVGSQNFVLRILAILSEMFVLLKCIYRAVVGIVPTVDVAVAICLNYLIFRPICHCFGGLARNVI